MRDEHDRAPGSTQVLHATEAALLELRVADGEHLVDEEDLRLEVRGHREREPHGHPARVALDRRVEEPLDAGEFDDLRKPALDLSALHPEDRAVEEDVLAPGELRVEPGSDLEQAAHAAADDRATRSRGRDACEHFQQRRLARAVASDDAEHLALRNGEAHVTERPDLLLLVLLLVGAAGDAGGGAAQGVAERPVRSLELSDPVSLRDLLRFDRERHQIVSAKRGSKLRNTASPTVKSAIATETLTAIWPQFGVASPSSAQRQPAITPAIGLNEKSHCHFVGICRHDHRVHQPAFIGRAPNPLYHWQASNLAQHLAAKPRGVEPRRNDPGHA